MNNSSFSLRRFDYFYICLVFIFLYPILPNWFAVVGINIRNFLSLFLIITFLMFRRSIPIFRFKRKGYVFLVLTWIIAFFIAYTNGGGIFEAFYDLMRNIFVPLILFNVINSKEKFDKAIDILIYGSEFVCIFGIIESLFHFNIFELLNNTGSALNYNAPRFGLVRIISGHDMTNSYAIYLSIMLSLVLYKLVNEKKGRLKFDYLIIVVNILLTFSRSMILATFVLQMVILFCCGFIKFVRRVFIGLVIVLLSLLFISVLFPELASKLNDIYTIFLAIFDSNYASTAASLLGDRTENAIGNRFDLYRWVFESMGNNWLLGNGIFAEFKYQLNLTDGQFYWTTYKSSIEVQLLYLLYHGGLVLAISEYLLYIGTLIRIRCERFSKCYWETEISFSLIIFLSLIMYFAILFSVHKSSEWRLITIIIPLYFSYLKIRRNSLY